MPEARLFSRASLALFALCFLSAAYFYQGGGWNANTRFDLTRAIVEDGSSCIDRFHENTGDKAERDGHYYCDKAPGQSWLGVPMYAVLAPFADEEPSLAFLELASYLVILWSVGLPSAAAVVVLYWLLSRMRVSRFARVAIPLAYALGSLAWPYATLLYGHQSAAAFLLFGFALIFEEGRRSDAPRRGRLFLAGLLLGWAVIIEYPAALALVAIGVYALSALKRSRLSVGWVVAGLAPPGLACALYHALVFGGPLTLPYVFSTQPHRGQGFFMGLGVPDPAVLYAISFSAYRGLFYSAPWLLLALPGAVVFARAGRRAEALTCGAIFALFVWLNSSLVDWEGGYCVAARYLIPALPFLALMVGGLFHEDLPLSRGMKLALALVFSGMALYAAYLMLMATAVLPQPPMDLKDPFRYPLALYFELGRLAVNTQSIDSFDFVNGGPPRAWNLGQRMGLSGLGGLGPLLLIWLVLGGLFARWSLGGPRDIPLEAEAEGADFPCA